MIDTDKYKGHTPPPWETNSEDSQGVWQEHDENIPRHIAMAHSDQNWQDMSETEFMRMMANKMLIADAPLILEAYEEKCKEVERLREENNRYLNFIFWLSAEHKGKELAWEYGDEKLAELLE